MDLERMRALLAKAHGLDLKEEEKGPCEEFLEFRHLKAEIGSAEKKGTECALLVPQHTFYTSLVKSLTDKGMSPEEIQERVLHYTMRFRQALLPNPPRKKRRA
ncbi:MAG: hypothetical protein KGI80_03955 [Verrucomicrobiota bacterium]|nr:hypothetical protein [Verrucomicrobiota bacterium]